MGVVRGVHQHPVAEKSGDGGEHVLALLMLDAAEEAAARQVLARLHLELGGAADIGVLLVHAPSPKRQPAKAAFEGTEAQARVAVEDPAADKRGYKSHRAPGMRGEAAEKDVVPKIEMAGVVGRIP